MARASRLEWQPYTSDRVIMPGWTGAYLYAIDASGKRHMLAHVCRKQFPGSWWHLFIAHEGKGKPIASANKSSLAEIKKTVEAICAKTFPQHFEQQELDL